VPHVNIKHFPAGFTPEQKQHLSDAITSLVMEHFAVPEGAVSIALEPVPKTDWSESVHSREITGRRHLLIKEPNYGAE
jgi:4-oxalocrotonate tautomerase